MATLVVPENVSYVDDARALQKACQGWGTDEKAIISILGHRNAAQRKQIRLAYSELFQEDLVKRLESELTGDFEKAVYRWVLDPEDRDAVLANVAIRKSGDYHVIVEIACVLSSEELLVVRRAYHARYRHSLEEDLAAHTTGDIRKVLVGLVTAFRILTTRSKAQLMATFNRYRDDHGSSITKDLLDEPADEFKTVLRTAIRCINDHKKYYEKILRNAIKKVGTDEDALTRVIVTRAEKDLNHIKEIYYKKNSVALDQAVAMDTSGDYKAFLLALLGKEE
ncbi:ANNEXIN [Salix koriyanagi]|uniref:Annexin n=1 Tax=Salix koriyanagi TaxID=2511006 RepID=A0A9Q0PVC3_9ROSI|nr:ANNEXIN [Salix koriyanagi]